jgi:trehalose 6-phosphate synthase/phosphatase
MAIGDDHTDEDTFKAMPEDAITIKVGSSYSAATYFLHSSKEVRALLQELCMVASYAQENRSISLKEAS